MTVIDNTCGKLNVALRGFHYEVGYLNVSSSDVIMWRPDPEEPNHSSAVAEPEKRALF